jgi:MoxR-like ATPase
MAKNALLNKNEYSTSTEIISTLDETELINTIIENIEKVIVGKRSVVELVVLSLLCEGHVLIEDIPGVGKTSLVSALAQSISCDFKRIQFTPDTMPSDITGFSLYNQKLGEFEFRAGAAMSNIVLADEINRTSAKTQASLLEIMEEKQITVDTKTYKMCKPYMILATQNPIDYLGTYPLPEAQLDRFLIKLSIGYPSIDEEIKIVTESKAAKLNLKSVATAEDIITLQKSAEQVHASTSIVRYIVEIINATRNHPDIKIGCSPRGCIALYNISRAYALFKGRSYIVPDDIKYLAPYVLPHRLLLSHDAKIAHKVPEQIIRSILSTVMIPVFN